MFPNTYIKRAKLLIRNCKEKNIQLVTAESCTGGLVASLLTEIPGSSAVFERGFITYSNESKTASLDVPATLIKRHGAVSAEVAKAMSKGALTHSKAHMAIAITGVAGPGGGTKTKPVGLVYIAITSKKGGTKIEECHFKGTRHIIRMQAVEKALLIFMERLTHFS